MKKAFKKQVIIGISGVAATILVAVAAYQLLDMPQIKWILYAVLAVFAACFFGSLLYIFGGMRSFIKGAGYGIGLVGLMVSSKELPSWVFGILIVAAVLLFIVRPLVKQYRRDREKSSDTVVDERVAKELREEEAIESEAEAEIAEFRRSIAFGEKSLLLLANLTGAFCQLIRGSDALYLARIGGELSGLDEALLRTDFSDESDFIRDKKDVRIGFGEIVSIRCRYRRETGTPLDNCGRLTIQTDKRKYTFAILETLPLAKLESFFAGLPFSVQGKAVEKPPVPELTGEEKALLPRLKTVCLILTILSFVAGAAFWFLPTGPVLYRILSAACILIPAVTFGLYIKFNMLLSADDDKQNSPMFKKTSVNIIMPLLIPSAVLALRTVVDFTVTGWDSLLLWSGAVFAVILLAFFMLTNEYLHKKGVIALFVMVALFFAPSAVMQVNGLYDSSVPTVYTSPLVDKHVSSGKSTNYYFTVNLQDGTEKDISVSKEYYPQYETGDTVTVVECSGLMGIGYVFIDEG